MRPYLQYSVIIGGLNYTRRLTKIIKLQKRAIKTVGKFSYYSHNLPILKELKLLTFEDIVLFSTTILMFTVFTNYVPEKIKNMFLFVSKVHSYNTSNHGHNSNFYVSSARTNLKFKVLKSRALIYRIT